MADTVDVKVLRSNTNRYVQHLTNESDGTGESAVVKLDISTLSLPDGTTPVTASVESIEYSVSGFNYVVLEWDATTNDEIAVLTGSGYIDWLDVGGAHDPQSTGSTGDVVLTTDGAIDGASYDITIRYKLKN